MLVPVTVVDTWTGRSWPIHAFGWMDEDRRLIHQQLPSTSREQQHQLIPPSTHHLNDDSSFYAKSDESSEEEPTRKKRRPRAKRHPHQLGDPPPKRGRPTANPCWTHFARLESRLVRCRHCNKVVKSACATNMTKHLERHHRLLLMTGGGAEGLTVPTSSMSVVSTSTDQQLTDAFSVYSTDNASHHHGLLDHSSSSHPSVIVHAPPAGDQKPSMDQLDQSIIHSWESHSMLGSMAGSPSRIHHQLTGSNEDGAAIGLGPASWASGGGGASSGQLDLSNSAASSWEIARPAAKRNRRTKHPVWELFRRTSSGQAQCQLCNAFVRSPCSSNFMGHLNRHHSEHYQDVYNRWLNGRRSCSVSESHVTSTTTLSGTDYPTQSNSGGTSSCTPTTPSGAMPSSSSGLLAPSTSSFNESFASFDYSSGVQQSYGSSTSQHFNMIPPPSLNCVLEQNHSRMSQSNPHGYGGLDLFHYAQPQHPMSIPDQSLVRPPVFVDHSLHVMHQQPHHDVHPQMPHPDQFGYIPPHSDMGHPHDQR